MVRKKLYGKTERISDSIYQWIVTEKLDGSNLCFFNWDGSTYVAQRNLVGNLEDLADDPEYFEAHKLYKGLQGWLTEHWEDLDALLIPGRVICGEWLGQGQLKYPDSFPRYNMFAKGRIIDDIKGTYDDLYLASLDYNPNNFKYAFKGETIPDYIGTVPVVSELDEVPKISTLDEIYAAYADGVGRPVEGFVVTQVGVPDVHYKYVRMKSGKLQPHLTPEDMERLRKERKASR